MGARKGIGAGDCPERRSRLKVKDVGRTHLVPICPLTFAVASRAEPEGRARLPRRR